MNSLLIGEVNFQSMEFLKDKGIPGLAEIDTRKLTRKIREHGTLKGRICTMDVQVEKIVEELKENGIVKGSSQTSLYQSFLSRSWKRL